MDDRHANDNYEGDLEPIALPPIPMEPATVRWIMVMSGGDDRKAAEIIGRSMDFIAQDDEAAHSTHH